MKFTSDVDIDFADRSKILKLIKHVPASICKDHQCTQHNTGLYVSAIPRDPITGRTSLDYKTAELRGYIKLDFLNVGVYQQVKDEQHLNQLLARPAPWHRLLDRQFCQQLIHIGQHYDTMIKMPQVVDSVPKLAMFLAVIRPAKRHLIGRTWAEISDTVWLKSKENEYGYKKAHAISYAHLVLVHMNLLDLANQTDAASF